MEKPKTEIVGYIVKVGVFGEELPFDEMLAIYQNSGVGLRSGDDAVGEPLSVHWKQHRFKGLDFRDSPGFATLEEAKRHYAEELRAPDGITVHVHLPGDVELSRDVTLYGCLFEVTREVG